MREKFESVSNSILCLEGIMYQVSSQMSLLLKERDEFRKMIDLIAFTEGHQCDKSDNSKTSMEPKLDDPGKPRVKEVLNRDRLTIQISSNIKKKSSKALQSQGDSDTNA